MDNSRALIAIWYKQVIAAHADDGNGVWRINGLSETAKRIITSGKLTEAQKTEKLSQLGNLDLVGEKFASNLEIGDSICVLGCKGKNGTNGFIFTKQVDGKVEVQSITLSEAKELAGGVRLGGDDELDGVIDDSYRIKNQIKIADSNRAQIADSNRAQTTDDNKTNLLPKRFSTRNYSEEFEGFSHSIVQEAQTKIINGELKNVNDINNFLRIKRREYALRNGPGFELIKNAELMEIDLSNERIVFKAVDSSGQEKEYVVKGGEYWRVFGAINETQLADLLDTTSYTQTFQEIKIPNTPNILLEYGLPRGNIIMGNEIISISGVLDDYIKTIVGGEFQTYKQPVKELLDRYAKLDLIQWEENQEFKRAKDETLAAISLRTRQYTHKEVLNEEEIELTTTREIEANGQSQSTWNHTSVETSRKLEPYIQASYEKATDLSLSFDERVRALAQMAYLSFHQCADARGSATRTDWLTEIAAQRGNIQLSAWKEGVLPDCEALSSFSMEEFIDGFISGKFSEVKPRPSITSQTNLPKSIHSLMGLSEEEFARQLSEFSLTRKCEILDSHELPMQASIRLEKETGKEPVIICTTQNSNAEVYFFSPNRAQVCKLEGNVILKTGDRVSIQEECFEISTTENQLLLRKVPSIVNLHPILAEYSESYKKLIESNLQIQSILKNTLETSKQSILQGNRLLKDKNFSAAIEQYLKAISLFTNNSIFQTSALTMQAEPISINEELLKPTKESSNSRTLRSIDHILFSAVKPIYNFKDLKVTIANPKIQFDYRNSDTKTQEHLATTLMNLSLSSFEEFAHVLQHTNQFEPISQNFGRHCTSNATPLSVLKGTMSEGDFAVYAAEQGLLDHAPSEFLDLFIGRYNQRVQLEELIRKLVNKAN